MRVWLDGQEITGLCTDTVVEKNLEGAGAEAEIRLVCAPMDTRLPRLDPACGQWVEVMQAEELLFSGRVERVSYDAAALELTLLAFDPISLLAKNHCRGPYRGTPRQITQTLCEECGLETGSLWAGDDQEVRLGATCERSMFRTIRNLYNDRCVLDWQNGKLEIYPKGASRAVLESGRLVDLTARNTCEEAVTQAAVYSGGNVAALATDREGIERYGLRHKDAYLSLQYETAEEQAKAMLKGVSRQARLTLTGRSPVKCGQIVTLDKPLMGVYGDYLVERVAWQCQGGLITTQLGVVSL